MRSQQWDTRFFNEYAVASLVDLGVWTADSIAVSRDGASICATEGVLTRGASHIHAYTCTQGWFTRGASLVPSCEGPYSTR